MAFPTKEVDPKLWQELLDESNKSGAFAASKKFARPLGFSQNYLYRKLLRIGRNAHVKEDLVDPNSEDPEDKISRQVRARARARKDAYDEIVLTKKERRLISDIAEGKVDLETASRVIAAKAFEKLLKFPDSASFTSFIQSELLKLKQKELTDKNTWAMELINRMFAGELPPRVCPNCGQVLVKLEELHSEVIEDVESVSTTR